jgi:hypothetical protein
MAAFPLEYISNLFNTDYILILHQSTILNQKTPITYSSFPSPCSLLSSLYSLESWYTAPRAPLVSLGATVSGNCFDHYRSMPDGNQIGLFYCQARRFRKEAPAASRQWDRGTESSKQPFRCHRERVLCSERLPREELACFSSRVMARAPQEF